MQTAPLPPPPTLLQEAGDRAAATGEWSLALKSWDAALAASAPDAHKLHEQKAQVRVEEFEQPVWRLAAMSCCSRCWATAPASPLALLTNGHLTQACRCGWS
jgi:hypothetical protein